MYSCNIYICIYMYVYIHQILDAAYSIMLFPMMSGLAVAATKGTFLFCSFAQMQLDVSKPGTKKNFDKEKKWKDYIHIDNSNKKNIDLPGTQMTPLFRLVFLGLLLDGFSAPK